MKTFKEHFIAEAKDPTKEFEKLDKQLSDIVKKNGTRLFKAPCITR